MRLDEDLHEAAEARALMFVFRVRGRNAYARMRVRDDHGAWARAPSTDTADPDAYTNAGDAAGIPSVGPPGTGARAQGSREGRQAPTPGREGATEGEPSRRAHPTPAVEGGPDGAAGGRSGRGHSAPDRRIRQRVSLREGVGRSRFGATA